MGAASITLPHRLSEKLSEKYLDDASELLKKGDLVQASEKFWVQRH